MNALTCIIASAVSLVSPAAAQCAGDIIVDGRLDGADLGILLANWGPVTTAAMSRASDLNADSQVDGADVGLMLSQWGTCPSPPAWATVVQFAPDPAMVTDPVLRGAIAATGLPWRVRDTATQIEMLLVPPGTFQMGCVIGQDPNEWGSFGCYASSELPAHQVTITRAYYLGRFEVLQDQWTATMGSNPSYFTWLPEPSGRRPVERVSWMSVQAFLANTGMRLPTEAEWEFACRAGTSTPHYNGTTGESGLQPIAWFGSWTAFGGNSAQISHVAGGRAPNALGLYDMLGNVSEWTNDFYGPYSDGPLTDPQGAASGTQRVTRGGNWGDDWYHVRSSVRSAVSPSVSANSIGFRVARNP